VKLSQLGEFGLIDRIGRRESKHPQTIVGIGDDAAVLKAGVNYQCWQLLIAFPGEAIPKTAESSRLSERI